MTTVLALDVAPQTTWLCASRCLQTGSGRIVRKRFAELTAEELTEIAPKAVLAPLISNDVDCIDIGKLLVAANFSGRFCIVAPGVPDRAMVHRELTKQFPEFDLYLLDALPANGQPRLPRQARA